MGRLPFDPERMKNKPSSAKPAVRSDRAPMSVSAFARMIERTVSDAFPKKVTIRGEVSGARHRTHWYFNLKDENAVISAVMFASAAKRSSVQPTDGRAVVVTGKLEYYAPQGRLSLIVESVAEDGEGSYEAQFRALCDDFRARGWFNPDAKKPIPAFPRKIAVLTADGSAAMHDVLDTARQRCPAVELLLIDVPVQGERAAGAICRAIKNVDASAKSLSIDAILLTRGGGSVEDLWSFNSPALAEVIHNSRLPIVAAIGHESDTTIAELVADHRSATPTQATVRLTPDRAALNQQLESLERRRRRALEQKLETESRRIMMMAQRPVMANPAAVVAVHRRVVDGLGRDLIAAMSERIASDRNRLHGAEIRLERQRPNTLLVQRRTRTDRLAQKMRDAMDRRLTGAKHTIDRLGTVLQAIDPTAVLERGYSITTREDGSLIRAQADAPPGTRLVTQLSDGQLVSKVEGAGAESPKTGANSEPQTEVEVSTKKLTMKPADKPAEKSRKIGAKKSPRPGDLPPQMDLFAPGE